MALTDGFTAPPAERVVARLRQHARRLFWPSLALVVICGTAAYFASAFGGWIALAIWCGAALLSVLVFLLPLGKWLTTRYTITTRRVIVRRGLFSRERREMLHSRGYTVTLRSSWLQALFRSGTITIEVPEQPTLARLHDVPHAKIVSEALHDLMENSQRMYPSPWSTGPIYASTEQTN
ncbi:PH domain-containing protein [Rathayibacter sp. CAU 1779]